MSILKISQYPSSIKLEILGTTPPLVSPSELVKKIALDCLKELGISLAIASAIVCFIPTTMGIGLLFGAIAIQTIAGIFFRTLGTYCTYRANENDPYEVYSRRTANVCEWLTGMNFSCLSGINAQTLIHEAGHSMAILSVYQRPRPRVEVLPFDGGLTKYFKNPLTSLGQKLGPVGSTIIVVASGPAMTLFISSILLIVALNIKDKYPQLGKALICWSAMDFLNHAYYAYSAYATSPSNLTHDFVHLSLLGLSPLAATIGILAIPVIITAGFYYWKSPQFTSDRVPNAELCPQPV